MKLDGKQRKALREAILETYPDVSKLAILLSDELEINFQTIASEGDYETKLFKLIETFTAEEKLEDFVTVLVQSRPKNEVFQDILAKRLTPGAVPADSKFYIATSQERTCYEEVKKPGSLLRIKSPKQMGKSSLMVKVLSYAKSVNYRTAILNLDQLNQKFLQDPDKFMQWFCASIGKQLRIKFKIEEDWDDMFGANDNSTDFFEKYLLRDNFETLVVAIDNFDRIFKYADIETDFCGLLRGWYERAKSHPLWNQLRQVIIYSEEPYLLKDSNQSPFNVGLRIELGEFSQAQVEELIKFYNLNWQTSQLEQLMDLVGGHPYLVRAAIHTIALGELTWERFLHTAPTEAGIYQEHLLRHLQSLEKYPKLREAMQKVVKSTSPVRLHSEEAFKLDSMGLVVRVKNEVLPRCLLYRLYFSDRLRA